MSCVQSELLSLIECYLDKNEVSPSAFGRQVAKDPRFVFDLRRGRRPGKRLEHRIQRQLAKRWRGFPHGQSGFDARGLRVDI